MKKTLIALLALGSVAMADDILNSVDQWTFDSNLQSIRGREFTNQGGVTTFSNGALLFEINDAGKDGLHLSGEANDLGLTSNWALQLTCTIPTGNTTPTAQVLACLDNASNGTQLAIANPNENGVYGFTGTNWSGWSADNRANTVAAIDTPMVLTIMNYNDALYLAQDDQWSTFGTEHSNSASVASMKLGKLTLGFGQGGINGLSKQTLRIDNLSVYQFDPTKVQVEQVKSALMSNVPEPTTGSLSLLALAGLCARRRKK